MLVEHMVQQGLLEKLSPSGMEYSITDGFRALATARVIPPLPRSEAQSLFLPIARSAAEFNRAALANHYEIETIAVHGSYMSLDPDLPNLEIGITGRRRPPPMRPQSGRGTEQTQGTAEIRAMFEVFSSYLSVGFYKQLSDMPRPFSVVFREQGRALIFTAWCSTACSSPRPGAVVLRAATGLDAQAIAAVQAKVRRRLLCSFVRRGLLAGDDARDLAQWRHGGGFSVDAAVRVEGSDRSGLERLLRYCARPPFATEQLQQQDAEHLIYEAAKPGPGGRGPQILTPMAYPFLPRRPRKVPQRGARLRVCATPSPVYQHHSNRNT